VSFKKLKSSVIVALRNTKAKFFESNPVDKIKKAQEKWENYVDDKEAAYQRIRERLDEAGVHLPSSEELEQDLTLNLAFIRGRTADGGFEGNLKMQVESSGPMSKRTRDIISDKFFNDKQTEDAITTFVTEESDDMLQEVNADLLNILDINKKKPRKKSKRVVKKTSKDKIGKLVDPHIAKAVKEAKSFKRASTSDRAKLKDQINAILEYHVSRNMESSAAPSSKEYLRYQTGRFAGSAEVTKIPTRTIYFTYQTWPYVVFDPKKSRHRGLSSSGRNPRNIISAALSDALHALNIKQPYTFRQDHSVED